MKKLRLTIEAQDQIRKIGRYTNKKWGKAQCTIYLNAIDVAIKRIFDKPELGKSRDDIDPGLKYFRVEKHNIFFRDLPSEILIVSILHTSMDPARHI